MTGSSGTRNRRVTRWIDIMWIGLFFFIAVLALAYRIGASNGDRDGRSYGDSDPARGRRGNERASTRPGVLYDNSPMDGVGGWDYWGFKDD